MSVRHLLDVDELNTSELVTVLDRAEQRAPSEMLAGRGKTDVVATDVWASMEHEKESEVRRRAFVGFTVFTVDAALMAAADERAVFLHWQVAANRMHATRGVLWWLLGDV